MSLLAFRDSLVALYNADSAVRTITGRNTLNLAPRGAQAQDGKLPILTYFIVDSPDFEGTIGHKDVLVQFEAWVLDTAENLYADMEGLMDRAEALFVGDGFAAEGIDASRRRIVSRRDQPLDNGVRSIRADMEFDLTN